MSVRNNLLSIDFNNVSSIQDVENEFNLIVDMFKKGDFEDPNHAFTTDHATYIELDPEFMNCVKCSSCNTWVSDVDQPNPVTELKKGVYVDDKFLCYDCLREYLKLAN